MPCRRSAPMPPTPLLEQSRQALSEHRLASAVVDFCRRALTSPVEMAQVRALFDGDGALGPSEAAPGASERSVRELWSLPVEGFEVLPGRGISCEVTLGAGGSTRRLALLVGSSRLMEQAGVTIPAGATLFLERHESGARTCVMVALEGHLVAGLAIADQVKPEARGVIQVSSCSSRACRMAIGGRCVCMRRDMLWWS